MNNVTYLSWLDIEEACKNINKQILDTNYKIDIIVSIQRGGCVPGVILSHLFCISEYYSIGIRTTSSERIKSERLSTPIIFKTNRLKNIQGRNVLIIDDVTNTGNTLQLAKNEIWEYKPANCKTAVLIWDGDNSSKCQADFYAKQTPGWVVFPWENLAL